MRSLHVSTIGLLGLLATACSSNVAGETSGAGGSGAGGSGGGTASEPCPDPPSPPDFEVGTGEKCFERLSAGQVVTVMQGPQGGYHLWIAVGCAECAESVTVRYGIKDPKTGDYFPEWDSLKVLAHLQTIGWPQKAGFTGFLPGVVYDSTTQLPKGAHVIMNGAILGADDVVLHEQEIEVELGDVEIWSPPCDSGPNCGAPGGQPCCTKG